MKQCRDGDARGNGDSRKSLQVLCLFIFFRLCVYTCTALLNNRLHQAAFSILCRDKPNLPSNLLNSPCPSFPLLTLQCIWEEVTTHLQTPAHSLRASCMLMKSLFYLSLGGIHWAKFETNILDQRSDIVNPLLEWNLYTVMRENNGGTC